MATVTEYNVHNESRPLVAADIEKYEKDNHAIYKQVPLSDMKASFGQGKEVHYVAQRPGGCSEKSLTGKISQLSLDMAKRKAFDHVHNLRSKVMPAMFDKFFGGLPGKLKPQTKAIFEGCEDFKAFCREFRELPKGSTPYADIVSASQDFRTTYGLDEQFWLQAFVVEGINADRNAMVHCSVEESAKFLNTIRSKQAYFPELSRAWPMISALVSYGSKHAKELDAAADVEERDTRSVLTGFKHTRR